MSLITKIFGLFGRWRRDCRQCGLALAIICLGGIALADVSSAENLRPGCDSCLFKVEGLDQAYRLSGTWLFTRDDKAQNKDVALDTGDWKLIKAPGPWKAAYADGRNYQVGWYRGVFDFAPNLIGTEVVFLIDAYMGRVNVYLDGQEIYRRPGNINIERYYSIQPIPVRFKITQTKHVVALRVDTQLMTGIYQLPFELRKYDTGDVSLSWYQFVGGEIRLIAAYVILLFGLFFLVVYYKTRYPLYLVAALSSFVTFPFFAAPGDNLLRIFPPEKLLYLHYLGVFCTFFNFLFCQFFYKFTPRLNWFLGLVGGSLALFIASMAIHPDLDLFQKVRGAFLLICAFCNFGALYASFRGMRDKRDGAAILFAGMLVFCFATINDLLLALGRIESVALLSTGAMTFTAAMLFVASNIFANTFVENKQLVKTLTNINDHLEDLVAERTEKLGAALNELSQANNDLRTSYEQLTVAKNELVRSEKLAALGSLVAGIAHELNTPLGNGLMATSTLVDQMNALKKDMAEKGPRRSTFEAFLSTVEASVDITLRSLSRSATLVSSFKQIAVDQTSSNRGKFKLDDLVKDVLVIMQPVFKDKPYQIESDLQGEFELDSYPGPLSQVLTNLINNAPVHAFEGRDHGVIRLTASASVKEGFVSIRVRDDGRGIAPEHLPKIFDPFFTTKLGQGSSGLGLHIVHNIVVQVLGGTLDVSSEFGVFTEFVVEIPLSAPIAGKNLHA